MKIVALVFGVAVAAAGSYRSSNVWMWVRVVLKKTPRRLKKKQKTKCFPEAIRCFMAVCALQTFDIHRKAIPRPLIGCWPAVMSWRLVFKTEWQTQLLQKGKCGWGLRRVCLHTSAGVQRRQSWARVSRRTTRSLLRLKEETAKCCLQTLYNDTPCCGCKRRVDYSIFGPQRGSWRPEVGDIWKM